MGGRSTVCDSYNERRGGVIIGIRYFTYDTLKHANDVAVRTKRTRSLYFDKLPIKREDGHKYPIALEFPHNDAEMRVEIVISPTDAVWLDIPFNTYEELPVFDVDDPEGSE